MKKDWFKLSSKNIYFLFAYNLILLIIGITLSILVLLQASLLNGLSISFRAILGGIGFSLVGSTIFYLRKLYKTCINAEIGKPENEEDNNRRIGVMFYFLLRPIFSMSFAILVILFLKISVNIVTFEESRLNVGFIYLSSFLSFFSGFSSGIFLSQLDDKGGDIINNIFSKGG